MWYGGAPTIGEGTIWPRGTGASPPPGAGGIGLLPACAVRMSSAVIGMSPGCPGMAGTIEAG